MENNEVPSKIERPEVWAMAIMVTLFTLLVLFILTAMFWDQLCAKIMLNALEYGMEQTLSPRYGSATPPMQDRRPASKRTKAWDQLTHAEKVEKVRASQDRIEPSETFAEELERLDQERAELEAYLFDDQDPNKR